MLQKVLISQKLPKLEAKNRKEQRVLLTKVFALTGVVEFTAYTIASRTSFLINALVIATANVAGILVGGALSREDENIDEVLRDLFKFMFYSHLLEHHLL